MRTLRNSAVFLALLAAACGEDPKPPAVFEAVPATALPASGATGVPLEVQPKVSLNLPPDLVTAAGALAMSDGTNPVAGSTFVEGASTLVFAPAKPLAASTKYTVTLAATVKGPDDQPLAAAFSWSFTTGLDAPPPHPPPLALVTASPHDGEDDVPLRAKAVLVFSRRMDGGVVDAIKLQKLTGRAVDVTPVLGEDGRTVTLTPTGLLGLSTTYVLRVTTDAAAADGTALTAERRWTFHTTDDPTHGEPLQVLSTTPADHATELPLKTNLRVAFSRPPDRRSVTAATVRIVASGTSTVVPASVNPEQGQPFVTALPLAPLAPATTYEVTVKGILSDEGLPMDPPEYRFSFTTSADPERGEHPRVAAVGPEDGTVDVPVTTKVVLTFSRPMDPASFGGLRPELVVNGSPILAVNRSYDTPILHYTLEPTTPLPPDADVTVTVPVSLFDAQDHLSLVPFSSTFHTLPDHVAPTITATSPADGAQDVDTNTSISFTFSEPVRTQPAPQVTLTGPSGTVAGSTQYNAGTRTLSFVPHLELDGQSTFTAAVSGVQDIAGNALGGPSSITFRTGGAPDTTPPSFAGLASATALDESHVRLTWSPGLDGRSAHLTYLVWQADGATVDFAAAPSFTTAADATSFDVPGLMPASPYAFAVRAMDAAQNVDANTVVMTVTTPDLTPPAFGGVSSVASVSGQAALQVGWAPATDNVPGPIRYRVYVAETSGGQTFTEAGRAAETAAGATSLLVTELRPGVPLPDGKSCFVVVRAVDAAGNESQNRNERSAVVADVHAPAFTGSVTATPTSTTAVRVAWDPAVDNVDAGSALTYRVSKRRVDEAQFQPPEADFASGLFRVVTGLAADTAYVFRVEVRDVAGNIAVNPNQPQAMGLDFSAPFFANFDPGVQATASAPGQATLTWTAAVDNRTAASAIVYLVYASKDPAAVFQATPLEVTGQTTAQLSGLSGGTWFFGVRARDESGNVDGNTATVSTSIAAP